MTRCLRQRGSRAEPPRRAGQHGASGYHDDGHTHVQDRGRHRVVPDYVAGVLCRPAVASVEQRSINGRLRHLFSTSRAHSHCRASGRKPRHAARAPAIARLLRGAIEDLPRDEKARPRTPTMDEPTCRSQHTIVVATIACAHSAPLVLLCADSAGARRVESRASLVARFAAWLACVFLPGSVGSVGSVSRSRFLVQAGTPHKDKVSVDAMRCGVDGSSL